MLHHSHTKYTYTHSTHIIAWWWFGPHLTRAIAKHSFKPTHTQATAMNPLHAKAFYHARNSRNGAAGSQTSTTIITHRTLSFEQRTARTFTYWHIRATAPGALLAPPCTNSNRFPYLTVYLCSIQQYSIQIRCTHTRTNDARHSIYFPRFGSLTCPAVLCVRARWRSNQWVNWLCTGLIDPCFQ